MHFFVLNIILEYRWTKMCTCISSRSFKRFHSWERQKNGIKFYGFSFQWVNRLFLSPWLWLSDRKLKKMICNKICEFCVFLSFYLTCRKKDHVLSGFDQIFNDFLLYLWKNESKFNLEYFLFIQKSKVNALLSVFIVSKIFQGV